MRIYWIEWNSMRIIGSLVDFFFRLFHLHHDYFVVIHSMVLHLDKLNLITMINWFVNQLILLIRIVKSINYVGYRIPSFDHRENKFRTNKHFENINHMKFSSLFSIALTTLPTVNRTQQSTLIYNNENPIKVNISSLDEIVLFFFSIWMKRIICFQHRLIIVSQLIVLQLVI